MKIEWNSMALVCAIMAIGCGYGTESERLDGARVPHLEPGSAAGTIPSGTDPAIQPAQGQETWVAEAVETEDEAAPESVWTDRLLLSEAGFMDAVGASADGSTVAYFRQTTGLASDLYVTRTDTGETRLVDEGVVAMIPNQPVVVSPDGATVLFRRTLDGGAGSWHAMNDLWMWGWEEGETVLISEGVFQSSYRFTPDGTRVIFAHTWAKDLYLYDLATRELTLISENVYPTAQNPHQSFPVSDDSRYLGYTTGYGNAVVLHLLDMETWEDIELAEKVVDRSARFVGAGWLAYNTSGAGGQTVHQFDLGSGEAVATELGNGFRASAGYEHIAYIAAADGLTGELRVWSREENTSISVDSGVHQRLYAFDESASQLVYTRLLEPSGNKDFWGPLHAWSPVDGTRKKLADYAWTDGKSLDVVFTPDAKRLAYRSGACGVAGNLRLVGLSPGDDAAPAIIGQRACGAAYATPDGASIVFASQEPARLKEYSVDTQTTATLAEGPIAVASSPDGAITVHTLQPDVDAAPYLRITNWETGDVRIITTDEPGLALEVVTDTHLVYLVSGPPAQLWLAELPR